MASSAIMLRIAIAIALLASTTPARASTFNFSQKFLPPDFTLGESFGGSVALDGDRALIFLSSLFQIGHGSYYLLDVTNGNILQKFTAPDGGVFGNPFRRSIALNGDYALIGSPFDDLSTGSAYLFDINSGNLLHEFLAPDGASNHEFGFSVAIDGDYALIGAWRDDDNGTDSGSAYLFDINSGNFVQKIQAPDGAIFDNFGGSVALDGDYALISASADDDNGTDSGSAYLFDINSGNLLQKFLAPDGAFGDLFGGSVTLDGNYALISAEQDDDNGSGSGSAYLFDINSGSLLQKFLAPDGASGDRFSRSVDLDGDLALIGSPGDDDLGTNSGAAYLFDINSGNLLQKFLAPDGNLFDDFGRSVAIDGNRVLIGSPGDDELGTNSGAAYLFAREDMEKVPEPSAILGLIAIGTLGVLKGFSGKQKQ